MTDFVGAAGSGWKVRLCGLRVPIRGAARLGGDMDKIAALSEILAQNPGDSFARYGLAMAYAGEGRDEEALAEYKTISDNDPDYVPAYQMSAQLLIKMGQAEAAKTRLTAGLAACKRTGNTHADSEMSAMLEELS